MKIEFNVKIPTAKGVLFGVKIHRRMDFCGVARAMTSPKLTLLEAHDKLGHIGNQATRVTASHLGWVLTDNGVVCESCAEGKARQKNIVVKPGKSPKVLDSGRVYLDISSVRNKDFQELENTTKPYWRIIVDEATQIKFSDFFESKSGMIEPTCEVINKWLKSGKNVKIIKCDDVGENRALEKRLKSSDWKMNLNFEYTGRDTSQRNHLAEVAFHTIANRGRAIMNRANVPLKYRYVLWREAFKTVTLLDGLVVIDMKGNKGTRYMHWEGSIPDFAKQLRVWGEAGSVKLKKRGSTKIEDRGYICMFVGYPESHSHYTFQMWDTRSQRNHVTKGITW
jgi:hypothetical protein